MDAATKRAMHGSCARVRRRRQNFRPALAIRHEPAIILLLGLVAQLVEQRIENPCVGGSIPPRATKNIPHETPTHASGRFCLSNKKSLCPVYSRFCGQPQESPTSSRPAFFSGCVADKRAPRGKRSEERRVGKECRSRW